MKLQLEISDKEKIVRIEDTTNVGELYDFLQAHFPNDKWKEFTLEVKTVIQWKNPIVIEKIVEKQVYPYVEPMYPDPWRTPWVQPYWQITCEQQASNIRPVENFHLENNYLKIGTYCVEVL